MLDDVRPATLEDIEAIIDHGRKFFSQGAMLDDFDPGHFGLFVTERLNHPNFDFFVTETGSCGICISEFFATGRPHVQVLWIFDEGGRGRDLMRRVIGESIAARASGIGATTQIEMRGDIVAEMYRRMGFVKKEILMVMDLKDTEDASILSRGSDHRSEQAG